VLKQIREFTQWLYRFLASKELTISLFALLSFFLAVTTFTEEDNAVIWAMTGVLLALTLLGLSLCTLQRIKTLSIPVIIIHIGVILTFIGGWIGLYGFVATVNIYEGNSADKVFRWDIEKDVSLGVDILVEKLHEEYYPVPVKVGVLKNGEKSELIILKTGEDFELDKYDVRVDSIDIYKKKLVLSVFDKGENIGSADTYGSSDLPPDFPYEFRLVAYVDPVLKKTRVDMKLLRNTQVVAEGSTEINSPFEWEGLNFYHTATNTDKMGNPYIGLQITKAPGTNVVYTGFGIISIGGVLHIFRLLHRRR
jgi:hypothetical protein